MPNQNSEDPSRGTKERVALYPGSFDPVTRGHLDVLDRALALFDRVVVGVLQNPGKRPLFDVHERLALLREESAADAAYELPMAHSNRLCGEAPIETVFLASAPAVSFIESRLVREIAACGGELEAFVTPRVVEALEAKFRAPPHRES